MRRTVISIVLISAMLTACTDSFAGLKKLIELGRNQAEIAKALNEETKNFNRVKEAIEDEELEEGMEGARIKKRYGEPIIDIFDKKRNVYKWLYMPKTSTHFEGEKIYLYVDKDGLLAGWQLVEQ